jgi:replication factor C subunit 2/4
MNEVDKLDYIREIGFTHMRVSEGLNSPLQIVGCVARLSAISQKHQNV